MPGEHKIKVGVDGLSLSDLQEKREHYIKSSGLGGPPSQSIMALISEVGKLLQLEVLVDVADFPKERKSTSAAGILFYLLYYCTASGVDIQFEADKVCKRMESEVQVNPDSLRDA